MTMTKSVNLTLLDADPRITLLDVGSAGGKHHVFMDTVAVTAADFDADGDSVILAEVPSNSKIQSIIIRNDDMDSATASIINVGIYNGGTTFTSSTPTKYLADALIDEDSYASAITVLQGAVTVGTEVAFEARDINLVNNYVWQDCGLPEDPKGPLRIALTQTAAVATAVDGDITVMVTYTVA